MSNSTSSPLRSPYFNAAHETMPAAQRTAWLDEKLQAVVRHAFSEAPGVRAVLERAGLSPVDVSSVADLDKVPITRKDELVELQRAAPPFGGFLGVRLTAVKRIYQSPGPLYDPEGNVPDYWRWAQALHAAGFHSADIVQNTASYHMTPLGFMFDEALRLLDCTVVPAGPGNTQAQLQIMRELGVTAYTGMPSYLMKLVEQAEADGWNWQRDFRLQKAFVIAEPFPPSLRRALQARGIVAREGYGTAETGNLGFECGEGPGWHIPYDVIVQVVDINTGHALPPGVAGEVVVTLLDPTYPLIRFGTGDLSAMMAEPCPCGRTTPRLVGWLGRIGQAVKVRGLFVHPRQIAQVMQRFPGVARFQGVVDRPQTMDRLTIRLEPAPGTDLASDLVAIERALHDVLKMSVQLEVNPVGAIPADAAPLVDQRTWQ